jgi:hypothetical protein
MVWHIADSQDTLELDYLCLWSFTIHPSLRIPNSLLRPPVLGRATTPPPLEELAKFLTYPRSLNATN